MLANVGFVPRIKDKFGSCDVHKILWIWSLEIELHYQHPLWERSIEKSCNCTEEEEKDKAGCRFSCQTPGQNFVKPTSSQKETRHFHPTSHAYHPAFQYAMKTALLDLISAMSITLIQPKLDNPSISHPFAIDNGRSLAEATTRTHSGTSALLVPAPVVL